MCLDYSRPDEYAFSRPCVIHDDAGYHMWFASRGSSYSIGYAASADGLHWERHDEIAGLKPAQDGWDSQMVGTLSSSAAAASDTCFTTATITAGRVSVSPSGNPHEPSPQRVWVPNSYTT